MRADRQNSESERHNPDAHGVGGVRAANVLNSVADWSILRMPRPDWSIQIDCAMKRDGIFVAKMCCNKKKVLQEWVHLSCPTSTRQEQYTFERDAKICNYTTFFALKKVRRCVSCHAEASMKTIVCRMRNQATRALTLSLVSRNFSSCSYGACQNIKGGETMADLLVLLLAADVGDAVVESANLKSNI